MKGGFIIVESVLNVFINLLWIWLSSVFMQIKSAQCFTDTKHPDLFVLALDNNLLNSKVTKIIYIY